jgi:hypothetical protein
LILLRFLARQCLYPQAYPRTKIRLKEWADALCAASRAKRIVFFILLLLGVAVAVLGVLVVALALLSQFAAPPTREVIVAAKRQTCDRRQLAGPAAAITLRSSNTDSRELTMATIRKGTKRFARWFNELREANRPRYRWYEHDLY